MRDEFTKSATEPQHSTPASSARDAVDGLAFDCLDEFGDVASGCFDALVSAARQGDKRQCVLHARQLSGATRAVVETVADLVPETVP